MPGNLVFPGGRLDALDAPERPGAFERCASREVGEETGVDVPPGTWRAAGERTTPPLFPVRFRTLFFVAELPAGATLPDVPPAPEEIEALRFAEARAVLADWEAGRTLVPPPLLPILRRIEGSSFRDANDLAAAVAEVNATEAPHPRIEF